MNTKIHTDEQVLAQMVWCEQMGYPELESMLESLLSECKRLQAEVEALRKDAERYFKLRDNPEDRDVLNTGMPWVVRVERINGVPTMNAIYGPELDFELDAARATPNETKEAKS